MLKKVFALSCLIFLTYISEAQSVRHSWIDSVYNQLDPGAKVGQLFMIRVPDEVTSQDIHEIENRIKSHEVGGLIFGNVGPSRQVALVNHFQSIADVPLLIAQDSDLSVVLDSTVMFPSQFMLGAIDNDTLLYRLGEVMARQYKLLGVNLAFKEGIPTDVALAEPAGQNKSLQSNSGGSLAMMRGLQDNGIICCERYYPLKPLPLVEGPNKLPRLDLTNDSVQSAPYAALFANGLKGITPETSSLAHYSDRPVFKKIDFSTAALTALYSGDWVRKKLDFHGLAFIDISKVASKDTERDGEAELFAFQTGNDILMNPTNLSAAIRRIKKLVKRDESYERQLDNSVRKILEAKFDAGLWKRTPLTSDNLERKLHNPEVRVIAKKLFEASVTVAKNTTNTLPLRILENRNFAYINTSPSEENLAFFKGIRNYVPAEYIVFDTESKTERITQSLSEADVIIVGVFPGTKLETLERINRVVAASPKVPELIFCDFGHQEFLSVAHKYNAVVTAYSNAEESFNAVPQVIFGALPGTGKLPTSYSKELAAGTSVKTPTLRRLGYSLPEEVRMNSTILMEIDSIAREAIRMGATPGCQVLVARNGKVIYEKNFGHYTYDQTTPVTSETIYDLASITKVAATLQTAMFMHEKGIIDLNRKVSYYLPELKKTNKKDIRFIDMLTHQSGLIPFLPMYPETMKDTVYLPQYYSRTKSDKYPLQVGASLYGSMALRDSIWSWVLKSKMNDRPPRTPYTYRYSDFGFLILQRVAEKMLNQPLDEFVQQNFYEPLGAATLGFNPLSRYASSEIAPTENDKIYRRSPVAGTVHDERAAMMGGVAGHAGLFGSATDLAKLGQMWLQNGYYGGTRFFRPETINLFTSRTYLTSRRGIGWDKPLQSDTNGPTSVYASPSTFGHTGFTGTCIWVDPEFDLVYVFLSNRVYPDRNSKLISANIRSRIQDVIYKSIFGYVGQDKPAYIVDGYAIKAESVRPLK